MNKRLELHEKLKHLVGTNNVYFQPPASVQISYPCVIYNVGNGDAKRADNTVYLYTNSYDVLFIFKKPNLEIIEQVLRSIPMCRFTRAYVADNLNHYAFTIYY
jgi:hypothetical protein